MLFYKLLKIYDLVLGCSLLQMSQEQNNSILGIDLADL